MGHETDGCMSKVCAAAPPGILPLQPMACGIHRPQRGSMLAMPE
jgi:hypothetical protein